MKTVYLTRYDDKIDVILQNEEGKCEKLHDVKSVAFYGIGCFIDLDHCIAHMTSCEPPTEFVDLTTSKALDDAYCATTKSAFSISINDEDHDTIMYEAEIDVVQGVTYKIKSSVVTISYKYSDAKELVTVCDKNIYIGLSEIENLESWSLDSFDYPLNARCGLKLLSSQPDFKKITNEVMAKLAYALHIDDEYDADKILATLRVKPPEKPSLDIMLNSEQPNIDRNYELNEGNIDKSIPVSMYATVTIIFPWE